MDQPAELHTRTIDDRLKPTRHYLLLSLAKEPSMWIDSDGVCHTVALPEPAHLMTRQFE